MTGTHAEAPARLPVEHSGFLSQPGLMRIFDLIADAGGEARVNGGAVRNALLGEPVKDVDLSTTLEPAHVTQALQRGGVKVVPTGFTHGTVTAVAGGHGYEITTLREDVETHGRHATVRFGTSWEHDVRRRDFTMNALYCDREGRIFDPLGGYGDLAARRVRFIGDPRERIAEDRLRILRFFRFYAWYGHGRPDADGLKACAAMKDGLRDLSAERIWLELRRLLGAPDPVRAILWMRTGGVMEVVLPESAKWGTDLIPRLHAAEKSLGWQPDAMLRLMAVIPPRPETAETLGARLKMSNADAERLRAWSTARIPASPPPELGKELYRGDPQAMLDRLRLERARIEGDAGAASQADVLEAAIGFAGTWGKPDFPLSGRDLVENGVQPGPAMGRLLKQLEAAWVESGFTLAKADLLARIEV